MNKIKLSKLANINMGQSPKSENYCNNEGTPFLQGNRTFGEKYPEIDIYTKQITKLAKKGEILISVRAPVGDLNIAPVDLCIGRGLSSINSFDGNNEFLYYCLKYNVRNILKQSSGTTYDSINRDILENFELITPKKEDYIKIGEILSKIDNKIELNNRINFELEAMAKTIYDYWFLQFEFPNEEGKPYKSSGGKMVWNDELKREIPEGWEVKKIKDCITHIKTGLNPRDNFKLGMGDIKYITVKNITTSGSIDFSKCDIIDDKAKEIVHNRSDISKGDILFASIAPLGRCYLIQEEPEKWDINESVFSIRPDYKIVSSEFLYMYFMSEYFIKKAERSSTGSIFSGIRINTIENMEMLVPNQEVIELFSSKIKNILYKHNMNFSENQELASLRDFLLPLLMNGQVGFKEE